MTTPDWILYYQAQEDTWLQSYLGNDDMDTNMRGIGLLVPAISGVFNHVSLTLEAGISKHSLVSYPHLKSVLGTIKEVRDGGGEPPVAVLCLLFKEVLRVPATKFHDCQLAENGGEIPIFSTIDSLLVALKAARDFNAHPGKHTLNRLNTARVWVNWGEYPVVAPLGQARLAWGVRLIVGMLQRHTGFDFSGIWQYRAGNQWDKFPKTNLGE